MAHIKSKPQSIIDSLKSERMSITLRKQVAKDLPSIFTLKDGYIIPTHEKHLHKFKKEK